MELPPGPRSAIWQTLRYLIDPVGMIASLAKKFGDPFTVPSLNGPIVVTGSPEGVRAIFSADPETFSSFAGELGVPLIGRGSVLLQSGARHRRSRKLMQPPFHGAHMRAYGQKMASIAEQHFAEAPKGTFDIEQLFRDISLEVILRTVFGFSGPRVGESKRNMLATVRAFGALVAMFNFLHRDWFPPWRKFVSLRGKVHALLQELVDERKDSPGEDICSLLVAARDEDGQPMEDQEMVEQLFTMVLAGHETTAVALAFTVDELWRRPDLVTRLRQEIEPTGGDPEKLASHKLLDAVCAEALRIRPLLPLVSRRLTRPFELGGHTIPAGVGVAAGVTLTHRREDLYPEPDSFRPERFMNGKSFSPHEYLPWGGGARRCLGAAFAIYEMKIVLGKLLLAGDIQLRSPTRARVAARAATVGPRGGVKVVYTPAP